MSGLHDGRIRALYLIGENPVQTEPNAHHVEEGMEKLDFVVAQDLFLNDSNRKFADVIFPASSFAEKEGTFTNTERRVNRVRKAVPCPGNAREDLRIVVDMAKALGADWPEYATAEDAWDEFADLAPLWSGIRYDRIEEVGLQWPCPDRDHPGSPYLHAPHPARAGGKGKFYPVEYQPPIEQPDSEYPFVLSTGRTLYHYNSATMTMREEGVTQKQEEPFVEMHPEDAQALGIEDGDWVRLVSRRRRARGTRQARRPRLPGPRVDGAPLRAGEGELAHARRRRPPHRHARVQDERRARRAARRHAAAGSALGVKRERGSPQKFWHEPDTHRCV